MKSWLFFETTFSFFLIDQKLNMLNLANLANNTGHHLKLFLSIPWMGYWFWDIWVVSEVVSCQCILGTIHGNINVFISIHFLIIMDASLSMQIIVKKHCFVKMKQHDVDASPPANIMTFRLGLTHLTFDLDPRDLWPLPMTLYLEHYT